ncbi:MAG TPA: hypothetical protein EYP16_06665 [Candidatus Atribacteria bacterium]|nr:hypothetical protein [Candidatus Atribacteria bacterium]
MGREVARTCPECGGEMIFDRRRYVYVCRACGLTLTRFELDKYKEKRRFKEDEADSWKKDYLKWWLSSKK